MTRILIPQIRSEKKIKVQDIADVLGITRQAASPYARGDLLPSNPDKFVALMALLGIGRDSEFGELFPDLPETR